MNESIEKELKNFANKVSSVLRDNFIGFYVAGSYAMGSWNPEKSDIDFFVITEKPITDQEAENLKMLYEEISKNELGKKLEGEIADLKMLQQKAFSNKCGRIDDGNFSVGSSNLSADNVACLIQFGNVVIGKPIEELGLNVSNEELDEAVLNMLKEDSAELDDQDDFKTLFYLLINMLRCIYTLQTEKLPSKLAAIEHNKKLIGDGLFQQMKDYLEGKIFEFPIDKENLKKIANFGLSLRK